MLVNPQFFNYRLIIGSLLLTIVVVSFFSFKTTEANRAAEKFIESEKKLIENEISQLILSYDILNENNQSVTEQLENAHRNTQLALNKLNLLTSDISVITRFKKELFYIKSKHSKLFKTVDSLQVIIQNLENEKLLAYNNLQDQQSTNNSLSKINANLKQTVERGALLTANSFIAKAYKSDINTSETNKALNANYIEVCFTLAENALTQKGIKDIYIQILNPLNNVVANKGAAKFGEFLLVYSDKQHISYNDKAINVCSKIQIQTPHSISPKGIYFISVFLEDRKLGTTQIELN